MILCSPLIRAVETANIINDSRNIPILIDEKLSERDFGEFEGMPTTVLIMKHFGAINKIHNIIKQKYQRLFSKSLWLSR